MLQEKLKPPINPHNCKVFRWFSLESVDKKIPAINAGRRFNNKKPAVRDLLTAGVVHQMDIGRTSIFFKGGFAVEVRF